jgi:LysR family transcriptional regulator, low CO2-responsive transcriptional regulator
VSHHQNRAYLVAFRRFLLEQAAPFLEREYAGFALQAREPAAETRLAK